MQRRINHNTNNKSDGWEASATFHETSLPAYKGSG